jgi:hypothetical protein
MAKSKWREVRVERRKVIKINVIFLQDAFSVIGCHFSHRTITSPLSPFNSGKQSKNEERRELKGESRFGENTFLSSANFT